LIVLPSRACPRPVRASRRDALVRARTRPMRHARNPYVSLESPLSPATPSCTTERTTTPRRAEPGTPRKWRIILAHFSRLPCYTTSSSPNVSDEMPSKPQPVKMAPCSAVSWCGLCQARRNAKIHAYILYALGHPCHIVTIAPSRSASPPEEVHLGSYISLINMSSKNWSSKGAWRKTSLFVQVRYVSWR